MIATLHLEEEWENHPTHKGAPEWSMDHEKNQVGGYWLDMRNLLSTLAMWTPHPPTPLTTIHDHGGTINTTLGANDVRALRDLAQLHRSATTQTQPLWIPMIAQLLRRPFHPAIGRTPQNQVEDLIVDNTKGSNHRGGRGKPRGRTRELVPRLLGGTSRSTRQPWKRDDAKK